MKLEDLMKQTSELLEQHRLVLTSLGSMVLHPGELSKLESGFRTDLVVSILNAITANATLAIGGLLAHFVEPQSDQAPYAAAFIMQSLEAPNMLERYNLIAEEARKQLGEEPDGTAGRS